MNLAYATTYNAQNLDSNWAGLGYYIAQSLKSQSLSLDYLGPLKERAILRSICKLKRHYHEVFEQRNYLRALDPLILQDYANQVSHKLSKVQSDVVFSPTITSTAYLNCNQPIVFWADATFAGLLDFYPLYNNLCRETIEHGHEMEKLALKKCALAIYASDWAAQSAINYYQADPSKVKVVPFGANIRNQITLEDIRKIIEFRPLDKCKLLFIGYDWLRKGGDTAVELAKALNNAGLKTELTIVGCHPPLEESVSSFVKSLGILSKSTEIGRATISQLLSESHFLIMPSKAECYGIVFCEASSFGLPSLATDVGGIPTIIKNNRNGFLFKQDTDISEYRNFILHLFDNYEEYKNLAFSAFHEYQSRLNWSVAGQSVKDLLANCV